MTRRHLVALTAGLALTLAACGDDSVGGALQQDGTSAGPDVHDQADGGADGASGDTAAAQDTSAAADSSVAPTDTATTDTSGTDTASGPMLTIVVEGDLDDRSPDDGLAAQTPKVYAYGLQRFELLESKDDPTPDVVFDYAPDFVRVDMLDRNVVAAVPIADLPNGTYPYFRIVLTHLETTVDATLHGVPVVDDLATELGVVYGLSDVDSGDLDLSQGEGVVSANVLGNPVSFPIQWPLIAPSPAPNAWAEAVDGEWRVTFAVSPALAPSSSVPTDVTYAITFYVTNSFRWTDQPGTGHADDVWDIDLGTPPTVEPVSRFGANAYEVYLEGF